MIKLENEFVKNNKIPTGIIAKGRLCFPSLIDVAHISREAGYSFREKKRKN